MTSAPVPHAPGRSGRSASGAGRRVVMITSPGIEPTLSDVATNLATACAETGQRVAIVSTAGLASPHEGAEVEGAAPLWWRSWPGSHAGAGASPEEERARLVSGPLGPADVEGLLGDTGVPGVSRLDLRNFVGHPAQVVVRMPDVLAALRQVVDVVILEVPSYTSVHHGEGLTPLADVVLVVGERETTTVEQTRRTSATLRKLGAPVVGMALTGGRSHNDLWGADSDLEDLEDVEDLEDMEKTEVVGTTEGAEVVEEVAKAGKAEKVDKAKKAEKADKAAKAAGESEAAENPTRGYDVMASVPTTGMAGEAPAARVDSETNGSAVTHARSEA